MANIVILGEILYYSSDFFFYVFGFICAFNIAGDVILTQTFSTKKVLTWRKLSDITLVCYAIVSGIVWLRVNRWLVYFLLSGCVAK